MGLEQKLRKIKEQGEREPVDWIGRRNKWLQQVDKLYNDVEKWVQSYVEEGYLAIRKTKKTNTEEHIGQYDIDALEIIIGDYSIMLDPIGTLNRLVWTN